MLQNADKSTVIKDMEMLIRERTETDSFKYMLLDRLRSDCSYFLGYGHRNKKDLWAGNVRDHIECMKMLWNSFPKDGKPEWLTMEKIEDYERKMCGECGNTSLKRN